MGTQLDLFQGQQGGPGSWEAVSDEENGMPRAASRGASQDFGFYTESDGTLWRLESREETQTRFIQQTLEQQWFELCGPTYPQIFFSLVNITVLRDPCLVESADAEG